jgi:hypothetical protein
VPPFVGEVMLTVGGATMMMQFVAVELPATLEAVIVMQ